IAQNMVAEVCSVYLIRDGVLELFATEGLKVEAVHRTTLKIGEGLVGLVAERGRPLALSEARAHPNFAYRPETGEELFQSLMGVPILSGGREVGVLAVQNKTQRSYTEDEIEVMLTIAMVLAEMVEGLLGAKAAAGRVGFAELPARLAGDVFNEGMARGTVVMHEPRVVVARHVADDVGAERERLAQGIRELRQQVDDMLRTVIAEPGGESREILEAYRMYAHDKGWVGRMQTAIDGGLTAEAAVERVQVETRTRMAEIGDPYLRERLHDLDDLSHRLLRTLTGHVGSPAFEALPPDAVVVARNIGPAELLDYQEGRVKALILEEGSASSHVVIVARALQIPVIGRIQRLLEFVDDGDVILVDGDHSQVFIRPGSDVESAFAQNLAVREAEVARYVAIRDLPAETRDGVAITLNMNAGLLVDLANLDGTGAEGIGLYRTELHFMVRATLPNVAAQASFYGRVLDQAGERPVVFRTLDVGGDKMLPYLTRHDEQNPAMGWRAIRLSLDRPVLLRMQLRALLRAAAGRNLNVMFPMVAEVSEFVAARALLEREMRRLESLGEALPEAIRIGTMLEVPGLAWQLPALLPLLDFISIGSNDLLQFLFASDRASPRLVNRYDVLSPPALKFLRHVVTACDEAGVPVSLCGEAAGHPIEAMALIGLGLRSISMTAAAVGPVKMMIRSLMVEDLTAFMTDLYDLPDHSCRSRLEDFARSRGVAV
ncbi:MAG: phosphoenolpyruvate--protein phosphotransferase, partial [Alphaproteobacteria bacterium]|nr:phosphoenolpyruvate--protein phosphotransferase [Alphaproteobacteria bacterium]